MGVDVIMDATVAGDLSRAHGPPVATALGTCGPVTAGHPGRQDGRVRTTPGRGLWIGGGAVAVLAGLVGAVLHLVPSEPMAEPTFWLVGFFGATAYGATAAFLAARRRAPALRAVLLGIGLAHGLAMLAREYAVLATHSGWPLAGPLLWIGSWLWAPAHLTIGALLPLLLPEGRLPSPRWRPVLALSALAVVATAAQWALLPYPLQDYPVDVAGLRNPVGTAAAAAPAVELPLLVLSVGAVLGALSSVVVRWRRSAGAERQQLKWLLLGVLAMLVLFVLGLLTPQPAGEVIAGLAMLPLPVACAVSVLRHRLWDVDVVLSRSLLYATVSAVVVASYVAVVGVLGGVLGAGTGAPVVATALVALLVLPLHARLQRLVNQLVHGEVEDPHAALAHLGERLAATTDPARLLPDVVVRLAGLRRGAYAAIELADGDIVSHGARPAEVNRMQLRYGGVEVGALLLAAGDPAGRGERRRLEQLALQAAVAVHAVLVARDLRRSRQLAVSAREQERYRLRHDLHDDLGPSLAALALQAETARDLVCRDPAAATALLDTLVPRLNTAVSEVRSLVHELRPATLDELGLAGALGELGARFATPLRAVHVELSELGELPAAVDVAAYRIVAEALANAARHADARTVRVTAHRGGAHLQVEVRDDGRGIDGAAPRGVGLASMRERAAELDGRCVITSDAGGTVVTARLPVGLAAEAAV